MLIKKSLIEVIMDIDSDINLDLARILLLLKMYSGRNNNGKIEGISMLGYLDFLLRYPIALSKTLEYIHLDDITIPVYSSENMTIESQMLRYKFSPWNSKYRKLISILQAKKLIKLNTDGKKVYIKLTEKGDKMVVDFMSDEKFNVLVKRGKIIKTKFGSMSAKKLIDIIYNAIPELLTMKEGRD